MQVKPECKCECTNINSLKTLSINNGTATSRITQQGAQLLEWTPKGHKDVLWLSKGTSFQTGNTIRGGLPVCWPYFGSHPYTDEAPFHGFARRKKWDLRECETTNGVTRVEFEYLNDEHHTYWPYPCSAKLSYLIGEQLTVTLKTTNLSSSQFRLSQAFHTYFSVGDIKDVQIKGLEGIKFIDTLDNNNIFTEKHPISINRETDRIYQGYKGDIRLTDEKLGRNITIQGKGVTSVVVWNPWIDKSRRMGDMGPAGSYNQMVCIETANVRDNSILLEPGQEYTLTTTFSVQNL